MNGEFYIGYAQRAPTALGRWLRIVVVGLLTVAIAAAVLLVYGQHPFAKSNFEFQQYRPYQGEIVRSPYPMLITGSGPYLLVAPGKHGASELLAGMNGSATLKGALIERGAWRMLELLPGSIQTLSPAASDTRSTDLGEHTLNGTIVDTKCFLGVMNPGEGKVHRDCAARCISGGIPPGFLVKDSTGQSEVLLLTASGGKSIREQAVKFAGEPIKLAGRLTRTYGILHFEVDPIRFPKE
jgi:hypothetical protein